MKNKRKLILTVLTITSLSLFAVFFNATVTAQKTNVIVSTEIVNLCNRKFVNYILTSAPEGVMLVKRSLPIQGLALPVFLPSSIAKADPNLSLYATVNSNPYFPITPDIPILPTADQAKICPAIQQYADSFFRYRDSMIAIQKSDVFQFYSNGTALSVGLKTGYQAAINAGSQLRLTKEAALKTSIETQYQLKKQQGKNSKPYIPYDFLIVYQNEYANEVMQLRDFYEVRGIHTNAVELSALPGYNANGPVPIDCNGEFYQECYHTWGDPVTGISQLAVPSLPGYVAQNAAFQQYDKVAFVPGLIRALMRSMNRVNPLRGALIVGSPQEIPPYNSSTQAYYYDGLPWMSLPSMQVSTDLYYSLPDVPLVNGSGFLAHEIMNPGMWSCNGPNGLRLDYWCQNNEYRNWSNPPLSAYRNPAHIPQGKIYSLKYGQNDPYWTSVDYNSVIPVGRIVTQERILKRPDPVVAQYVQKLNRWYRELPSMKNTSINSNAGSTADDWIYSKSDIDQFVTTFGPNSKIYASEFFVPSYKCAGRCQYVNGEGIMTQMGQHNMAAFFLNGHGGHIGIQAPYGNGNLASGFGSESATALDGNLHLEHMNYPSTSTIKQAENTGRLIGIIFANSCSPSNYVLANETHYLYQAQFPDGNPRSWSEQWIAMNNAGAMNTYQNGDVGWGGSDNDFNVAFMQRIKTSWNSCGNIGDAQRTLILDGLRSGYTEGIGYWQLLNRHFLGSPLNHIGLMPLRCYIYDAAISEKQVKGTL